MVRRRFVLADFGKIEKAVSISDFVIEIVDARNPLGTRSSRLERIARRHSKKLFIVLNKADLIPPSIAYLWKKYFEDKGFPCVPVSARFRKGTLKLRKRLRQELPIISKKALIGVVAGVPKTGKSTLINILRGKHGATTSPYPGKPGYTHTFQTYRITGKIYLIDTPGVLPDPTDPIEKIIRTSPPEKIRDPIKPALHLLRKSLGKEDMGFLRKFGVEAGDDPTVVLEKIAYYRGWFDKKTKEPLIDMSAQFVIRAYLDGRLNPYEKPPE